jgi:hypothetical protein
METFLPRKESVDLNPLSREGEGKGEGDQN